MKRSRHIRPASAPAFATDSAWDTVEARTVPLTEDGRNLAAVLLGRQGGLKGGRARAAALTPQRRREIAQKAAQARWSKHDG